MNIYFHHSYNLDVLNLLDILIDDQLADRYIQEYNEFSPALSLEARNVLVEVSAALGGIQISPLISFALSVIPQFEKAPLVDLLLDQDGFLDAIRQNEPRLMTQKDQLTLLFQVLAPVVKEIEYLGFREYWTTEYLSPLEDEVIHLEDFILHSPVISYLQDFFGEETLPDEMHIYVCALNDGKGVRLTRFNSITDFSFSPLNVMDFGLHEVIKDSISRQFPDSLCASLSTDKFIQLGFEKSKTITGSETIEDYIRENLVEAVKVFLFFKAGLMPDPINYLQTYKQGVFVLSVILLDHFYWNDPANRSLNTTFDEWSQTSSDHSMMDLYKESLEHAGKNIGEQ